MSTPRLLTLLAVRLAGFAEETALADRARRPLDELRRELEAAGRAGEVEVMRCADAEGWILTERGSARLAVLLEEEVASAGAGEVLAATVAAFEQPEGINATFVETVSRWQRRSTDPTHGPATGEEIESVRALLCELDLLGSRMRTLFAELIDRLPRFERYPLQYERAVDRARADGLGWVTGVGILSCHVVWAELHQDLRSTTGGDRPDHAGSRR